MAEESQEQVIMKLDEVRDATDAMNGSLMELIASLNSIQEILNQALAE